MSDLRERCVEAMEARLAPDGPAHVRDLFDAVLPLVEADTAERIAAMLDSRADAQERAALAHSAAGSMLSADRCRRQEELLRRQARAVRSGAWRES